ncbi:hypothetical protein MJO29_015234 [Puccinia striiformis f. sp. tritici]|nr:hypothetical protein MJO29_015234 [Puccinia striiformis f. sp. tritici]
MMPHHPMKPHQIKMAHNLILNAGLNRKMDMLVRLNLKLDQITIANWKVLRGFYVYIQRVWYIE